MPYLLERHQVRDHSRWSAVPKVSKASETNKAIRPSGLRRKMRSEIPQ
jgi:hypothetical protein